MSLLAPLAAVQACNGATTIEPAADPPEAGAAPTDAGPDADEDASGTDARPDRVSGECTPIELDAAMYNDSGTGCSRYLKMPCGIPQGTTMYGCSPDLQTCIDACESSFRCVLAPEVTCTATGGINPDADTVFECVYCSTGGGRRPRGLSAPRPARGSSALGAYFAALAHLEAASVVAFRDLARWLAALDAPGQLRRRAERAADDERRHAGITRRLAHRFGGSPRPPEIARGTDPSLEELLADNVVEGCVGESYGAMVAMWQAARAADPEIARTMHGIAADEAKHAELSWDLLRWGAPRLDEAARRRLEERFEQALASLRRDVEREVDGDVVEAAGHPPRDVARALVVRFERFVRGETQCWLAASVPYA